MVMLKYECYDCFGNLVAVFPLETKDQKEVIVSHRGIYYKPIIYDFISKIVKCGPIDVVQKNDSDMIKNYD